VTRSRLFGCRAGFTLIEVLVAATVLTLFVLASSAAFTTAARLQVRAKRLAARTSALERFVVAAGPVLAALPDCVSGVPESESPSACIVTRERCDVAHATGTLSCAGGPLIRAQLRLAERSGAEQGAEVSAGQGWHLEAWAVAP